MRAPLGRVFIFGSASDVAIGRKRASLVFWLRSGTVASTVSPGASSNTVEQERALAAFAKSRSLRERRL